jgi:protein NrfD
LVMITAMLLALQLVFWILYVGVKATSGGVDEARAALRWTRGDRALGFWAGVIGLGLTVPLVFFISGSDPMVVLGDLAVLVGGLLMRLAVVAGDDRIWLPGEEAFAAMLPHSREAFLHAWK